MTTYWRGGLHRREEGRGRGMVVRGVLYTTNCVPPKPQDTRIIKLLKVYTSYKIPYSRDITLFSIDFLTAVAVYYRNYRSEQTAQPLELFQAHPESFPATNVRYILSCIAILRHVRFCESWLIPWLQKTDSYLWLMLFTDVNPKLNFQVCQQ